MALPPQSPLTNQTSDEEVFLDWRNSLHDCFSEVFMTLPLDF